MDAMDMAIAMIHAEIRQGHIMRYRVTHDRRTGREIHIETDGGWNPEPFWQEYPMIDAYFGANDTNPD